MITEPYGAKLVAERINHVEVPFPEGESYASCVSRVRSFLLDLVPKKVKSVSW